MYSQPEIQQFTHPPRLTTPHAIRYSEDFKAPRHPNPFSSSGNSGEATIDHLDCTLSRHGNGMLLKENTKSQDMFAAQEFDSRNGLMNSPLPVDVIDLRYPLNHSMQWPASHGRSYEQQKFLQQSHQIQKMDILESECQRSNYPRQCTTHQMPLMYRSVESMRAAFGEFEPPSKPTVHNYGASASSPRSSPLSVASHPPAVADSIIMDGSTSSSIIPVGYTNSLEYLQLTPSTEDPTPSPGQGADADYLEKLLFSFLREAAGSQTESSLPAKVEDPSAGSLDEQQGTYELLAHLQDELQLDAAMLENTNAAVEVDTEAYGPSASRTPRSLAQPNVGSAVSVPPRAPAMPIYMHQHQHQYTNFQYNNNNQTPEPNSQQKLPSPTPSTKAIDPLFYYPSYPYMQSALPDTRELSDAFRHNNKSSPGTGTFPDSFPFSQPSSPLPLQRRDNQLTMPEKPSTSERPNRPHCASAFEGDNTLRQSQQHRLHLSRSPSEQFTGLSGCMNPNDRFYFPSLTKISGAAQKPTFPDLRKPRSQTDTFCDSSCGNRNPHHSLQHFQGYDIPSPPADRSNENLPPPPRHASLDLLRADVSSVVTCSTETNFDGSPVVPYFWASTLHSPQPTTGPAEPPQTADSRDIKLFDEFAKARRSFSASQSSMAVVKYRSLCGISQRLRTISLGNMAGAFFPPDKIKPHSRTVDTYDFDIAGGMSPPYESFANASAELGKVSAPAGVPYDNPRIFSTKQRPADDYPCFLKLLISDPLLAHIEGTFREFKSLLELTHTELVLSGEGHFFPGSHDRLIAISGSSEGDVFAVLDYFIDKIFQLSQRDATGQFKPRCKIAVPRSVVGSLIGKNGLHIQSVRMATGAHVFVSPLFVRADEACSERLVTVSSRDRASLRAAMMSITRKINEHLDSSSCRSVKYWKKSQSNIPEFVQELNNPTTDDANVFQDDTAAVPNGYGNPKLSGQFDPPPEQSFCLHATTQHPSIPVERDVPIHRVPSNELYLNPSKPLMGPNRGASSGNCEVESQDWTPTATMPHVCPKSGTDVLSEKARLHACEGYTRPIPPVNIASVSTPPRSIDSDYRITQKDGSYPAETYFVGGCKPPVSDYISNKIQGPLHHPVFSPIVPNVVYGVKVPNSKFSVTLPDFRRKADMAVNSEKSDVMQRARSYPI